MIIETSSENGGGKKRGTEYNSVDFHEGIWQETYEIPVKEFES